MPWLQIHDSWKQHRYHTHVELAILLLKHNHGRGFTLLPRPGEPIQNVYALQANWNEWLTENIDIIELIEQEVLIEMSNKCFY